MMMIKELFHAKDVQKVGINEKEDQKKKKKKRKGGK